MAVFRQRRSQPGNTALERAVRRWSRDGLLDPTLQRRLEDMSEQLCSRYGDRIGRQRIRRSSTTR
jgi:hypothetical protein